MDKYFIYDGKNDEIYEGDIETIKKLLDENHNVIICKEKNWQWLNMAKNKKKVLEVLEKIRDDE